MEIALLIFIIITVFIIVGARACLNANQADWGYPVLNAVDGLIRLFCKYYHHFTYQPLELPTQGPAIVVANHYSGLDAFLMITAARRPLRFLIAREEYNRFGWTWLFRGAGCIPVDRSKNPEIALRAALRALQSGEVVALFPHGRLLLPNESPPPIRRGGLSLAQQVNCAIYPVCLTGIKGVGHVVRGVLLPSHAQLTVYPPITYQGEATLAYLQTLLGRAPS